MHTKLDNIPQNSKFMEGTGESAWFHIEKTALENEYLISRYTKEGLPECKYLSILQTKGFNISEDFEMTFVSHCTKCNVLQNKTKYTFLKKK